MFKSKAFLGEKLREMKALWENTTTTAKKRLDDLRVSKSTFEGKVEAQMLVSEQRRQLEHFCGEVPDASDASDNSPEANRRCEEGVE